jgi:hypothetical protein
MNSGTVKIRELFISVAVVVLLVGAIYAVIYRRASSAKEICQQHQAMVWDTAGSYYLEHSMKPDDLIDPQQLKSFFAPGEVPRCTLGTNDYAPFKLFDGPRCPHVGSGHGVVPMSEKTIKIKRNTP